jgi:hypothetical protein
MDAKKITEDYHDWHNIAELRLLGLSPRTFCRVSSGMPLLRARVAKV